MNDRSAIGTTFLLCILALFPLTGCGGTTGTVVRLSSDTITTMSGLRYIDYQVVTPDQTHPTGTGKEVQKGDTVVVDYAGFLLNGTLFDTSMEEVAAQHDYRGIPLSQLPPGSNTTRTYDRGGQVARFPFEPLVFPVGVRFVIAGWDEGLTTNMRVGGRRRLIVPPQLGYGEAQNGAIPPNATLVFDVHVLETR